MNTEGIAAHGFGSQGRETMRKWARSAQSHMLGCKTCPGFLYVH